MAGSDSDSESECFESAEESLDEEKIERKPRSKKSSRESECEVAEFVVSQNEEVNDTTLVKGVSNKLQSYRKRRERVKPMTSIPSPKTIHKTKKTSDTVFKTDVADVFFQDITNNLSKNINKSLHTLQQTSSNVKDLILSSLPASSACENESFVYDDNSDTLPPPVDAKVLSNETWDDKTPFTKDCSSELLKCLSVKNDEIQNVPNIQNRDNNKFVHSDKEYLELNSGDDPVNKNAAQIPDLEISHLIDPQIDQEFKNSTLNSPILIKVAHDINVVSATDKIKKSVENSNECHSSDQVSSSLKLNNKKLYNCQENKVTPCQSSANKSLQGNLCVQELANQELKSDENVDPNLPKSIVPSSLDAEIDSTDHRTSSEIQDPSNSFVSPYSDIPNKEINLDMNAKNLLLKEENTKEENIKVDLTEMEETIQNCSERLYDKNVDYEKLQEEKIPNDLIANTAELILNKENEMKNEDETLKDETKEIEFKTKECNDGWDDFDFSDNEIENSTEEISKSSKLEQPKDAENTAVKKVLTEAFDFSENQTSTKPEKQDMPKTVSSKKHENAKNITSEEKKSKETSEKKGFDDGWDWESWDDETDNTEKNKEMDHTARRKNSEKSNDVGQWSGWDSFSQAIEEKQGNWNIGTWGVNLLLNKATAVTQGISNVLEAGLGAPDLETLARMQKEEERQLKQELEKIKNYEQPEESPKKNSLTGVNLFPVSGITNLVAGVTSKIVEHTKIQEIGSKVLTGGLDTLETFGKKTMEVLQDGDPGLRNKRAILLGSNKPVLSQILREAREKADKEIRQAEEHALAKKCHFEILFDDFQGMVHLEALEMLSRQYELKLEQLKSGMSSEELEDLEGVLEEVEQLCALDELDLNSSVLDFKTSLQMALGPLKEEISVENIIQIQDKVNKWLQTSSELGPSQTTLHQKAVSTVAELTAAIVHEFLKAGELLSIKECRKTVDEIDALAKLTNILCLEINQICEKFILIIQKKGDLESTNTITQKITVMRNNSTSYIKQAFNLLIPILQAGAAF